MTQGVVESLRKDRTGLKLSDGKWYKGEDQLPPLNRGDTVELELDEAVKDSYGNPVLTGVNILKKAPNPFKGGGNAGTTPPIRSKNFEFQPRGQDPETSARIARSHAITTAVAILGDKKDLKTYLELAERIREYTERGTLPTAAAPKKAVKKEENLEDDLEF